MLSLGYDLHLPFSLKPLHFHTSHSLTHCNLATDPPTKRIPSGITFWQIWRAFFGLHPVLWQSILNNHLSEQGLAAWIYSVLDFQWYKCIHHGWFQSLTWRPLASQTPEKLPLALWAITSLLKPSVTWESVGHSFFLQLPTLVFHDTTASETPPTFLTISYLLWSWFFFLLLLKSWGSLGVCALSNAFLSQ